MIVSLTITFTNGEVTYADVTAVHDEWMLSVFGAAQVASAANRAGVLFPENLVLALGCAAAMELEMAADLLPAEVASVTSGFTVLVGGGA